MHYILYVLYMFWSYPWADTGEKLIKKLKQKKWSNRQIGKYPRLTNSYQKPWTLILQPQPIRTSWRIHNWARCAECLNTVQDNWSVTPRTFHDTFLLKTRGASNAGKLRQCRFFHPSEVQFSNKTTYIYTGSWCSVLGHCLIYDIIQEQLLFLFCVALRLLSETCIFINRYQQAYN